MGGITDRKVTPGPGHEDDERYALEVWRRQGVIIPGYSGEIAAWRRLHREWAEAGEPLR